MSWVACRAFMLLLTAALLGARDVAAQSGDSTLARRPTAAELQALRRDWLARQRAGAATGEVNAAYGSARVGADGRTHFAPAGPPGPFQPDVGIPVRCEGVLIGAPGSWPGAPPSLAPAGHVFRGQCVALSPYGPTQASAGGAPFSSPYGPGRGLTPFDGVTEYDPWGYPLQRYGWRAGPGAAYGFTPWPGVAGGECARVQVSTASGYIHEVVVALRSMGIADPADLDLAIDARLSRGLPVDLPGVDGRWIRLDPGALLDDIRVLPCTR